MKLIDEGQFKNLQIVVRNRNVELHNLKLINAKLLKAAKQGLDYAEHWIENEGVMLDLDDIKQAIKEAEAK